MTQVKMSAGFTQGWNDGNQWGKQNRHLDKNKRWNLKGDLVTKVMRTFVNKPHGYDAGFTEGMRCALNN